MIVAYRATWEDEELAQCTIADLEETVKARKLWKHTLFLVGPALGVARDALASVPPGALPRVPAG